MNSDMNWEQTKQICDGINIEFKNQSISSLVSSLNDSLINCKVERKLFTTEERSEIKISQGNKCAICE